MNQKQIITLLLNIAGIVLICFFFHFLELTSLSLLTYSNYLGDNFNLFHFLMISLFCPALTLITGLVLLIWGHKIAHKITSDSKDIININFSSEQFKAVLLSITGIILLCFKIPALFSSIIGEVFLNSNAAEMGQYSLLANVIFYSNHLFLIIIGAILIVYAKSISSYWHKKYGFTS